MYPKASLSWVAGKVQMFSHQATHEAGFCMPWIFNGATDGGRVRRIENLYGLYELGTRLSQLYTLLVVSEKMDSRIGTSCVQCIQGLNYVARGEIIALPRTRESAEALVKHIDKLLNGDRTGIGNVILRQEYDDALNPYFAGPIKNHITGFQFALSEELRTLPVFSVEEKGNLSIDRLVVGAADGYAASCLGVIDDFIKQEINEAGRCLAFSRATSCGFHILRAVEISVKGYVYAANGTLPPMNRRNWGEYIALLTSIGADVNLIDLLKILKTKRNPLMHPKDNLTTDEAIGLFCICQSVIETLVGEIDSKGLTVKFKNALAVLPTM